MREHVKILGILNIALGGLSALGGLAVLLIAGGVAGALGIASTSNDVDAPAIFAGPLVGVVGIAIAAFLICLGLPAIIGGFGLLNGRPWARVLVLVLSVFHLFHIPIGTAIGLYGLWVLLNEETQRLFMQPGRGLASVPRTTSGM